MTHQTGQGVFGDGDNPDSVIYANNSEIYGVKVNGTLIQLTNRGVLGNLEDAGVSGIKILGGNRTVGSTYFRIRNILGGTGITLSESGNALISVTNSDLGSKYN